MDVGIIGGADGPTAVFVSSTINWGLIIRSGRCRCGLYRCFVCLGKKTKELNIVRSQCKSFRTELPRPASPFNR
jgi:hypothetical protein